MSLPPPIASAGGDLAALRFGSVLAPLDHLGVLRFSGEDANAFLQGQLSCDVAGVGPSSATYGAHCSPKGRMLANFLLWREEAEFLMSLSLDIAPALQKQITKYVLRAKVKVSDVSAAICTSGTMAPGRKRC